MSPVSRGRKTKKGSKAKKGGRAKQGKTYVAGSLADAEPSPWRDAIDEPELPEWFDAAIERMLDGSGATLAAQGPRELEQAVAELLGCEMHRAVNDEAGGLWFELLFEELAHDAADRVRGESSRPGGAWEAPWRLLHGLSSISMPGLRTVAQSELALVRRALPAQAAAAQPRWLKVLPKIAPTGKVWEMRDAYGTRFAVIAGFSYAGEVDPSVFLFDIDACGQILLAGAGVFDDVEKAAAAWREPLGAAAADAAPTLVHTAEQLTCLAYLDSPETFIGSEPRAVMDNWLRASRRLYDLGEVLRKRGLPLPGTPSLYHNLDTTLMEKEFAGWYERRHGRAPDAEVVGEVAEQWLEGALPGTWHSVSPHRAKHQLDLISDWMPDDLEFLVAAKTLLPEWVRWNGEASGLPPKLLDPAVAAAEGAEVASDSGGWML